jgi:hypothetical protein
VQIENLVCPYRLDESAIEEDLFDITFHVHIPSLVLMWRMSLLDVVYLISGSSFARVLYRMHRYHVRLNDAKTVGRCLHLGDSNYLEFRACEPAYITSMRCTYSAAPNNATGSI